MGFYFRKSKSLLGGLFRLNFSKRGVGVSTGVKGARFVVGPAGTYVHLGQKGFYYKKYLGKGLFKSDKEKEQYNKLAKDFHIPAADEIPATITTNNFDRITDSESTDFINELQEKDKKIRLQKILGLYPSIIILLFIAYKLFEVTNTIEEHQNFATIKNETVNLRDQPTTDHSKILEKSHKGDKFILFEETENHWFKVLTANNDTAYVHGSLIATSNELTKSETIRRFDDNPNMRYILFGAAFIPLLLLNIFLYSNDKRRKSIFITYELDEIVHDLQKDLLTAFKQFSNSNKKWQIVNAQRTSDAKYSAGANVTVDRKEIKELSSHKLPSPFFETNIKIPFIGLQNTELYFLPDRLLLKRNNKFAAVQYSNLNIDILPVSFREYSGVPSDATVADYTYKYVNKSGGADRRFSNNPRIPICAYTEYHFSSDEGINEIIMPSKSDALDDFVIQLKTIGKLQSGSFNVSTNEYTLNSELSSSNGNTNNQQFNIPHYDPLFQEAAQIIVDNQVGSASLLQRKLKLGYNRAGKIIDELEEAQILGSFDGTSRRVLIKNTEELNLLLAVLSEPHIEMNEFSKKETFITNEYYDLLFEYSHNISLVINKLTSDSEFIQKVQDSLSEPTEDINKFISGCVLFDMIQIFKILNNGSFEKDSMEVFGLIVLSTKILTDNECDYLTLDYNTIKNASKNGFFQQDSYLKHCDVILGLANLKNPFNFSYEGSKDDSDVNSEPILSPLSLPMVLKVTEHSLFSEYSTILYRFATIIAKADNVITKKEEAALKEIYKITHNPITEEENKSLSISEINKEESLEDILKELNELIGLDEVKKEVKTLINFVQIQKEREKQGLKSSQISYHCVFTGSPGTGKTTIARLVAKIYKHLGVIEKGQLVETDRSGLVAEYTGQTSVKVDKVVKSALDGVLFIDEAYSLVGENKDDFGKEAVAALIKRMEDNRDRLVLIVAGYSVEMKTFIDTNPGFKSRFNRYIYFPDYIPTELFEIFELLCSNSEYIISSSAKEILIDTFTHLYETKTKDFGNGRLVRNIFEKSIENQSNRIALADKLTKEILTTIEAEDIPNVTIYAN